MDKRSEQKKLEKIALEKQIQEYLKKGGKIEKLRTGMTADEYHQREPGTGKVRKRGR